MIRGTTLLMLIMLVNSICVSVTTGSPSFAFPPVTKKYSHVASVRKSKMPRIQRRDLKKTSKKCIPYSKETKGGLKKKGEEKEHIKHSPPKRRVRRIEEVKKDSAREKQSPQGETDADSSAPPPDDVIDVVPSKKQPHDKGTEEDDSGLKPHPEDGDYVFCHPSLGCEAVEKHQSFEMADATREIDSRTNSPEAKYYYQLVTSKEADMTNVLIDIDTVLQVSLAEILMFCLSHPHTKSTSSPDPDYILDFISLNEIDTLVESVKCSNTTEIGPQQKCNVYMGKFTSYVSSNSSRTDEEINERVLWTIEREMNGHVSNENNDHPLISSRMMLLQDRIKNRSVKRIIFGGVDVGLSDKESLNHKGSVGISAVGGSVIGAVSLAAILSIFAVRRFFNDNPLIDEAAKHTIENNARQFPEAAVIVVPQSPEPQKSLGPSSNGQISSNIDEDVKSSTNCSSEDDIVSKVKITHVPPPTKQRVLEELPESSEREVYENEDSLDSDVLGRLVYAFNKYCEWWK